MTCDLSDNIPYESQHRAQTVPRPEQDRQCGRLGGGGEKKKQRNFHCNEAIDSNHAVHLTWYFPSTEEDKAGSAFVYMTSPITYEVTIFHPACHFYFSPCIHQTSNQSCYIINGRGFGLRGGSQKSAQSCPEVAQRILKVQVHFLPTL